jgi:S-sulfo-L-cysteine synthase (3-phospho-L-serine-dependent)
MTLPLPTLYFVEVTRPPGVISLISAARDEGLDVVALVCDPTRNIFLRDLAVTCIETVTQDALAVAEAINRTETSRVAVGVTTPHEFYTPVAAAAARLLGLPGPNPEAIAACRRKDLQRLKLAAAGVRTPEFFVCATLAEAKSAIARIGAPLVVKTVALTEGFGVRWCNTAAEAERHAGRILSGEFNATRLPVPGGLPLICLVESPLRGRQYTVEVFDGSAVGMTASLLGPLPGFLEISSVVPPPLEPSIETAARHLAEQAVAAMDLAWGPIHVELRVESDGPAIVEINARLAGGGIPRILKEAAGLDLCRATVRRCCGRPVDIRAHAIAVVAESKLMVLDCEGEVTAIGDLAAARAVKGILSLDVPIAIGSMLRKQGRNSDAVGWAQAVGSNYAECTAAIEEAFALAVPQIDSRRAKWLQPAESYGLTSGPDCGCH